MANNPKSSKNEKYLGLEYLRALDDLYVLWEAKKNVKNEVLERRLDALFKELRDATSTFFKVRSGDVVYDMLANAGSGFEKSPRIKPLAIRPTICTL